MHSYIYAHLSFYSINTVMLQLDCTFVEELAIDYIPFSAKGYPKTLIEI
jgi:hypothetical protein